MHHGCTEGITLIARHGYSSLLGKGGDATLLEQITARVVQSTALSANSAQPPLALIGPLVDQFSCCQEMIYGEQLGETELAPFCSAVFHSSAGRKAFFFGTYIPMFMPHNCIHCRCLQAPC